ncbi:Putative 2,5-dichloro-2,5-cyclohexadiene-1,4-diol dehydrogenase [Penicillium brasilianum]|uniref:Putative 2,5-dichloro-2,5-cyclohexadiene-1,4-diol dehydrogenase n=1 Tax=Penicillium brasilianum TaxID=104259 RepID=A0A0F7TMY8_PENBI|nr:Putative 2,5-dichloro-2,5-cyclohexadiene-1,4-diol dehydrogenase [Penicillium brasilianum]
MDSGPSSEPPPRSLKGKAAIVTGAGCLDDGIGNGRAISILLAADGCDVLCVDLNLEWANKTVEMVGAKPNRGRAISFRADVTSEADCESAVQAAIEHFGRLDILVNNVGIGGAPGTAVDVDMVQWAKSMEINVSSMVQMSKYAIPMMARNEGENKGSIINMGSVAGLKGGTPHLLYPTSKGAIVNLTRAMAAHHASEGIRVNCVCPGMLYTPMMYGNGMSEEAREARRKRSLLGTEGNGWDCAGAVVFLAGPHARWMTGVILPVDAGTTAAVGIGMTKSASVNG